MSGTYAGIGNHAQHTTPPVVDLRDDDLPDPERRTLQMTLPVDVRDGSTSLLSHSAQKVSSWLAYSACCGQRNVKTLPHFVSLKKAVIFVTMTCVALLLLCLAYAGNQVALGFRLNLLPWRAMADVRQRLPQAIIVGVRKCGTRALLEFLSLHPDVCRAHEEVHFFDRDARYSLGLDWYARQMPPSRPGQITIEKTPGYFIARHAPSLIRSMNGSISLLLIVRDPVTRIISDYTQTYSNRMKRNLTYATFEELVIDERTGDVSALYKPTWISIYYVHYMQWLHVFNRSQIHLVDGDALVDDPIQELRKAETFLGLRHWLTPDNFYFNKTRGFFCLKKGSDFRCLNPSKGRAHPTIKPRVLHKLYRFFKPYNEKFFKLSGQYFDWSEEKRRKKQRTV